MKQQCGACGARRMQRFDGESLVVEHRGLQQAVSGLGGLRCAACGDEVLDADSAQRYASVGDALVMQSREQDRCAIRRIRKRLGLTQAQAALLTGGGPNAFSRYETGKATPMPAVINLFRLLDAHPELLSELPPVGQLPSQGDRSGSQPGRRTAGSLSP